MTVCSMTRSKVKVNFIRLESRKFAHFQKLSPPPTMMGGSQMTTDSYIYAQYLKLIGAEFLNFVSVFVLRDFEFDTKYESTVSPVWG